MRIVTKTVTQEVEIVVYEPGDKFRRPGSSRQYVLATFHVGDKCYGALVNVGTGESVHKLKPIANYDEVTAEELVGINFTNPPAAKIRD